jgi:predicted XRE-type DNA-binding protein
MSTLKAPFRASRPGHRTYRSVDAMLRATGQRRLAQAVRAMSAKTLLIDQLIVARARAGYTQSQLATKMDCSQSRVSKFEDSQDADLTLGDLQAYAKAVGLKLEAKLQTWSKPRA